MNWPDERHVRVYVRDTAEWVAFPWQAKALWLLLLRKMDRAGVIYIKSKEKRVRLLSGLVAFPLECVELGLPVLLEDGCLVEFAGGYVAPGFIEAQECATSDAERKRKQREKTRDVAMFNAVVTNRDILSQPLLATPPKAPEMASVAEPESHETGPGVTIRDKRSRKRTKSHERSRAVTPCRAVPSFTDEAPPSVLAPVVAVESGRSVGENFQPDFSTDRPTGPNGQSVDLEGDLWKTLSDKPGGEGSFASYWRAKSGLSEKLSLALLGRLVGRLAEAKQECGEDADEVVSLMVREFHGSGGPGIKSLSNFLGPCWEARFPEASAKARQRRGDR